MASTAIPELGEIEVLTNLTEQEQRSRVAQIEGAWREKTTNY